MGTTSRSRGSSPGSSAELEPGAACYGYIPASYDSLVHNSRSFWQESVNAQLPLSLLVGQCAQLLSTRKVTYAMITTWVVFNLAHAQRNRLQLRSRCHVSLCNDFGRILIRF